MIHVSTDYVFDGLSKLPLSENSNTNPINQYGSSKLKGEQACLKNDTNSIIIRTSWLYSSFGKNFVKTMIDLMKKNKSIRVVNDQIGSPTYAYDLAKVIIEIIMNSENKSGLFHYSNEGETSWFEFARSIKELYNLDCKIIGVSSKEFKTLAKRPKYSLLNKSKIKTTFKIGRSQDIFCFVLLGFWAYLSRLLADQTTNLQRLNQKLIHLYQARLIS